MEPSRKRRKLMAIVTSVMEDFMFPSNEMNLLPIVLSSGNTALTLLLASSFFREDHFRIPLFSERWLTNYLDTDFYMHFRMTRDTYENLLSDVGHIYVKERVHHTHMRGRPSVPIEKSLLIMIWYLAKGDTYASVSDRFDVTTSTVFQVFTTMLAILEKVGERYICWPKENECRRITNEFSKKSKYPNIIGAIDGCHIKVKVPEDQQDSYLNRKFFHSILLQGICTPDNVFTNIFVGFPGSAHDARVLKYSQLYQNITKFGTEKYFYDKYHLVGDSAYPCRQWLMTPYRDTGRLTIQQRKHNTELSKARISIEHTFGILKCRWKILQHVNCYSISRTVDIIKVCAILHNFCISNNDVLEIDIEIHNPGTELQYFSETVDEALGIQKRNEICMQLSNN